MNNLNEVEDFLAGVESHLSNFNAWGGGTGAFTFGSVQWDYWETYSFCHFLQLQKTWRCEQCCRCNSTWGCEVGCRDAPVENAYYTVALHYAYTALACRSIIKSLSPLLFIAGNRKCLFRVFVVCVCVCLCECLPYLYRDLKANSEVSALPESDMPWPVRNGTVNLRPSTYDMFIYHQSNVIITKHQSMSNRRRSLVI